MVSLYHATCGQEINTSGRVNYLNFRALFRLVVACCDEFIIRGFSPSRPLYFLLTSGVVSPWMMQDSTASSRSPAYTKLFSITISGGTAKKTKARIVSKRTCQSTTLFLSQYVSGDDKRCKVDSGCWMRVWEDEENKKFSGHKSWFNINGSDFPGRRRCSSLADQSTSGIRSLFKSNNRPFFSDTLFRFSSSNRPAGKSFAEDGDG